MTVLEVQGWWYIFELLLTNNQFFQGFGSESFRSECWSRSLFASPDPVVRENCLPWCNTPVLLRITSLDKKSKVGQFIARTSLDNSTIKNS